MPACLQSMASALGTGTAGLCTELARRLTCATRQHPVSLQHAQCTQARTGTTGRGWRYTCTNPQLNRQLGTCALVSVQCKNNMQKCHLCVLCKASKPMEDGFHPHAQGRPNHTDATQPVSSAVSPPHAQRLLAKCNHESTDDPRNRKPEDYCPTLRFNIGTRPFCIAKDRPTQPCTLATCCARCHCLLMRRSAASHKE